MTDSSYRIVALETEPFHQLREQHEEAVFADNIGYLLPDILSPEEMVKVTELGQTFKQRYQINLGMFHGDTFVGWSFGFQENASRFYMCNSGILPQHRRQGLYTQLMTKMIQLAQNAGFQEISSRHHATNNAVIIPKLKAGFVITGLQVEDRFGTLVALTYYSNPTRRHAVDYRVGLARPNETIQKLLKI